MHYERLRTTGKIGVAKNLRGQDNRGKICKAEGCKKKAYCAGYCPQHYQQMRFHGKLTPELERHQSPDGKCELEGCERKHFMRGLCQKHHHEMVKRKCVEYKGGRCQICGYDGCTAALEFHHLDPKIKEKNIFNISSWKWKRVKKELDKTILMCANCHRKVHYENFELEEAA